MTTFRSQALRDVAAHAVAAVAAAAVAVVAGPHKETVIDWRKSVNSSWMSRSHSRFRTDRILLRGVQRWGPRGCWGCEGSTVRGTGSALMKA